MLMLALPLLCAASAGAQTIERVSVGTGGGQGNGQSGGLYGPSAATPDGRYVVFGSSASNLVAGDTNDYDDIFVHDRNTGQTTRVSVASGGGQAHGDSRHPAISADGRYAAFESFAPNLIFADTNGGKRDIFVHDRTTGTTTCVSVANGGQQGNDHSFEPDISGDGRHVAFTSWGTNLVPGDSNGRYDVFVHDRVTGQTTRVSVASDGTQADDFSRYPTLSADGRYVAFQSTATNLVGEDTNGKRDIFVHDRDTGQTTRVSVWWDGTQAGDSSSGPSISADGRYVAFTSSWPLAAGDLNYKDDVYVYDRTTGQPTLVSVGMGGVACWAGAKGAAISPDGRFVGFSSYSNDLAPGTTGTHSDVFLRDLLTQQTVLVSAGPGGTAGNDDSFDASVSAQGARVAFSTMSDNFVFGDTNEGWDVYVRQPWPPTQPELVVAVAIDPSPVKAGWPCRLTTVVQNLSQTTAPPSTVAVWRHYAMVGAQAARGDYSHTTDGLGPGATQTFTDTFTPSYAGARRAYAIVDVNNNVEEESENNNSFALAYTIGPSDADLAFQSFTVTPDPVNLGNEATITAAITNQGTDPSTECLLQLWRHRTGPPVIGTAGDFTHTVGALAPRATRTFTSRFFPHFQNYRTAWGLVDSRNLVAEQDESNNKASYQYKIDPGDTPDLVCAASAAPNPVTLGDAITLTASVQNIGTVDAAPFTLAAWRHRPGLPVVGSPPDVTWPIAGLAISNSVTRTTSFTPNYAGARTAWAFADSTNAVIQNNEGNNIVQYPYAIVTGGEPDLAPTVWVTPDPTSVGATTTLRIDVNNAGSTAAGPFTLAAWRHRATAPGPATPPQLTWPMVGLGIAATVSVTDTFTPNYAGNRTAWAFVDQGQAVVETNEANNIDGAAYTISAAGGAGALAVTAASAAATRGGQVAIAYSLSAPAEVELRIRNIAGRLVARVHVGEREAGSNTETWNGLGSGGARVPAGVYLCGIVARTDEGQRARAVTTVRLGR